MIIYIQIDVLLLKDVQEFLRKFQRDMNWEFSDKSYVESKTSMLNNYMLLTTEVSEIAEEFRAIFNKTYELVKEGLNEEETFKIPKNTYKGNIGNEISDCIAYLVKFANYLDIDLEDNFYTKMSEIKSREKKD